LLCQVLVQVVLPLRPVCRCAFGELTLHGQHSHLSGNIVHGAIIIIISPVGPDAENALLIM
jgi:hypothetical protein